MFFEAIGGDHDVDHPRFVFEGEKDESLGGARALTTDHQSGHRHTLTVLAQFVRFTGRQVRMRVEDNTLSNWRVGVMRLEVTPGGRR